MSRVILAVFASRRVGRFRRLAPIGLTLLLVALGATTARADDLTHCVQTELQARGLDPGAADGALGQRTIDAAAAFARSTDFPMPPLAAGTAAEWCAVLRGWENRGGGLRTAVAAPELAPYRNPDPAALPYGIWFHSSVPEDVRRLILEDLAWLNGLGTLEGSAADALAALVGLPRPLTGSALLGWLLANITVLATGNFDCPARETALVRETDGTIGAVEHFGKCAFFDDSRVFVASVDVAVTRPGGDDHVGWLVDVDQQVAVQGRVPGAITDGRLPIIFWNADSADPSSLNHPSRRGRPGSRAIRVGAALHESQHVAPTGIGHRGCEPGGSIVFDVMVAIDVNAGGTEACDDGHYGSYLVSALWLRAILDCGCAGAAAREDLMSRSLDYFARVMVDLPAPIRIPDEPVFRELGLAGRTVEWLPPLPFFDLLIRMTEEERWADFAASARALREWAGTAAGEAIALDSGWAAQLPAAQPADVNWGTVWLARALAAVEDGFNVPLAWVPSCAALPIGCPDVWRSRLTVIENGVPLEFTVGAGATLTVLATVPVPVGVRSFAFGFEAIDVEVLTRGVPGERGRTNTAGVIFYYEFAVQATALRPGRFELNASWTPAAPTASPPEPVGLDPSRAFDGVLRLRRPGEEAFPEGRLDADSSFAGTAILVSPCFAVTTATAIAGPTGFAAWAKSPPRVDVYPGRVIGFEQPGASAVAVLWGDLAGLTGTDPDEWAGNWALLRLDPCLGETLGWAELSALPGQGPADPVTAVGFNPAAGLDGRLLTAAPGCQLDTTAAANRLVSNCLWQHYDSCDADLPTAPSDCRSRSSFDRFNALIGRVEGGAFELVALGQRSAADSWASDRRWLGASFDHHALSVAAFRDEVLGVIAADLVRRDVNPATQPRTASLAGAECDRTAARHDDPDRPPGSLGVSRYPSDITVYLIEICQTAIAEVPDVRRYSYQLGHLYWNTWQFEAAALAFLRAATLGSSKGLESVVELGFAFIGYDPRLQVGENTDLGLRLLREAIAMGADGLPGRLVEGAIALLNGASGLPASEALAAELFRMAAATRDRQALTLINNFGLELAETETNVVLGREVLLYAAVEGHPAAMANLGYAFTIGASPDNQEAVRWYRAAADAGDTVALYELGQIYELGLAGPVDLPEARVWYGRAAAAGDADAMYLLGMLLFNGEGGAQNRTEARAWLTQAADNGIATAMYVLGVIYEEGLGTVADIPRAADYYVMALERRDPTTIDEFSTNANAYASEIRRAVQRFLIAQGLLNGTADGEFGPLTLGALSRWAAPGKP